MDAELQQVIQTEVQNAVQSTQDQMLNSMTTLLDSRLEGFQRKIQDNQKVLSDTQIARMDESLTDSYKFRKRGNEEQHKHNQKVYAKIREVHAEFETDNLTQSNINSAKRKISEGMDLIKNRQKLIKLADSSDAGWRVVEEYVTNPLAEDSEDEKKMYKAQSRAESKLKKEKLKRRPDRKSVPYTQQAPAKTTNSIPVNVSGGSRSDVRPGRCFYCNEYGHWIRNCPKSAAEQKHKISIDTSICKIDNKVEMYTHPKTEVASGELYSMRNVNSITQTSRDVQSMSNTHTTTIVKCNGTGVGHLKESLSEWKRIGATDFVLDIIANGYKIPFSTIPCMVELQNNKSARDNPEFVQSEIEKLLEKGCITKVSRKPYVVNPLTVAHNRGSKLRLVLDARHINPYVVKFKHKYEDAKTARQLYDQGDFVFSYDLKSAYHHISIFETDTTYLGFKWEHEYFVYNVLPFGLSTSGYIFTKVVREVIKYWRSTGLKIVMYLDDGLGGGKNMKEAMLASEKIHSDLEQFGFVLASEKCNWVPIQGLDWLGFHWDMIEGVIRITEKRIEKLLRILEVFRLQFHYGIRLFRVKFIASIVGQIISMQPVLGDQARLRTRYLYQCILQRASWNAKVLVSTDAFEECNFWEHKVENFNEIGSRLSQLTYNVPQDYYVFSDASGTGFGGFVTTGSEDEPLEMFGSWSMAEQAESSTWRELEAVKRLLINFVNILSGKIIRVFTDNLNITHILNIGSRKMVLHKNALFVDEFCRENAIKLSLVWLPRESNQYADTLSRVTDCDDWEIRDDIFLYLDHVWGPHDIDRFAHDYNAKCKHFNSKFWCPGTAGIDSFTVVWGGQNNWIVPPPSLIPKVINKIRIEKCNGTLVIPEWTSAPFWPMLVDRFGNFKDFIVDRKFFQGENLTKRGRGQCGVFGQQCFKFRLIALRIEF